MKIYSENVCFVAIHCIERKAKQAENKMRQLVKSAREDYKRNSVRRSGDSTGRGSMAQVFRESAVLLGNVLTATKPRYAIDI